MPIRRDAPSRWRGQRAAARRWAVVDVAEGLYISTKRKWGAEREWEETSRARGMLVASREASRCTRRASACYRYSVLVARARERMASSAITLCAKTRVRATGSKPEISVSSQLLAEKLQV